MKPSLDKLVLLVAGFAVIALSAATARGQDTTDERLRQLERQLRSQQEEIRKLKGELDAQRSAGESLETEMDLLLGKLGGDDDPNTMRMKWDEGIRFATSDKRFRFKFGGRVMTDWGWFSTDDDVDEEIGDFPNMTEVRRARLYLAGNIYENVFFKGEYDFAGGDVDLKDVYLGLQGIPILGHVKVGYFKEFWSLERQTSSKYVTFLERSIVDEAFYPGRNMGLGFYNHELDDTVTWGIGVFNETDGENEGTGDGLIGKQITGRVTFTPYREDGDLVHLGLGYSRLDPPSGEFRIRSRPEEHQAAHRVIDTKPFDLDSANLLGLEGAVVFGPFSAQAEYVWFSADSESAGDPSVSGLYILASWFLTGESRPYRHGAFDRVKPRANFLNGEGGPGAWQVAVRYSYLDLDDGDLYKRFDEGLGRLVKRDGSSVDDVTLGLNWYLNPNTRVMLNYILSDIDGIGDLRAFAVRFQIDF